MPACAKALFLGSLRIIPIFSLRGWCKSIPEKLLVDPSLMTLDRGHAELDDGTVEMLVSDFFIFLWILSNFSTSVEVTLIC
jgi:hypothetical protein